MKINYIKSHQKIRFCHYHMEDGTIKLYGQL